MGVTYYGGENVVDLVPHSLPQIHKNKLYHSKHRQQVKEETSRGKHDLRTMGYLKTPLNPPKDFLKSRERTGTPKPKKATFKYTDERKPPVPRAKSQHKPTLNDKNFIQENAISTIRSTAKRPIPKFVDSPGGNSQELMPSGMYPKFCQKDDYGKTPDYINRRKKEMAEAQKEYDAYVQERLESGKMKRVPDAERARILEGLKTNWNLLHHQFQGLSVITDTIPKRNRKEMLEREMDILDKDIKQIEAHPILYIS